MFYNCELIEYGDLYLDDDYAGNDDNVKSSDCIIIRVII